MTELRSLAELAETWLDQARKWQDLFQKTVIVPSR